MQLESLKAIIYNYLVGIMDFMNGDAIEVASLMSNSRYLYIAMCVSKDLEHTYLM